MFEILGQLKKKNQKDTVNLMYWFYVFKQLPQHNGLELAFMVTPALS